LKELSEGASGGPEARGFNGQHRVQIALPLNDFGGDVPLKREAYWPPWWKPVLHVDSKALYVQGEALIIWKTIPPSKKLP
jgi:hypothetical protein